MKEPSAKSVPSARIVIVVDENDGSIATVKGAIAHIDASGLGAASPVEADVVAVVPKGESAKKAGDVEGPDLIDVVEMMRRALALLEDAGIKGRQVVLRGKPAKQIVRYVNDEGVDLLVIGSCYRRRFRKSKGSGQIGRKVSQRAHCPVLFIMDPLDEVSSGPARQDAIEEVVASASRALERVAVAIDGSQESLEAVRHAIRIASHREGVAVSLITVIPVLLYADADFDPMAEYGDMQKQVIEPALDLLDDAGVASELVMLHGRPADEIARYANGADIDLLVVGSRALTDMYAIAVGGSVSRRLTAQVRCPLLIVKKGD